MKSWRDWNNLIYFNDVVNDPCLVKEDVSSLEWKDIMGLVFIQEVIFGVVIVYYHWDQAEHILIMVKGFVCVAMPLLE